MSTTGWIVLGVIVVLVLWIIMIYNQLVAMRQRVSQSFADIDVQLKQRHDLIPNLVETVKGYAAHERGTLEEVVKLRNSAMTAQGPTQQAAAENMLTGALGKLFALAEAYPDLKANQNFQQLQTELGDLENKISAARPILTGDFTTQTISRSSAIVSIIFPPTALLSTKRARISSTFFPQAMEMRPGSTASRFGTFPTTSLICR